MVGAATAILLLIIVLCVCCPWPCGPANNKNKDIESKGNIECEASNDNPHCSPLYPVNDVTPQ